MIERRRPRHTRVKWLEIPQVAQGSEDRCSSVGNSLAGAIGAKFFNIAGLDPRGNNKCWKTAAKSVEVERIASSIGSSLGVAEVIWARGERGLYVVVEASGFVKGDDEQSVVPLRTIAKRIVELLEKNLAIRHEAGGMHGVGPDATARRVDVGELGKTSQISVLEELIKSLQIFGRSTAGFSPVEIKRIAAAGSGIVSPCDVKLC
jgi:hypothetical protein